MVRPGDLSAERCLNHPVREAAARCPGCRRHFCRECVTEHDGRALCAACIPRDDGRAAGRRRPWGAALLRAVGVAAGIVLAWFYFYLLGRALLLLPDDRHPTTRTAVRAGDAP